MIFHLEITLYRGHNTETNSRGQQNAPQETEIESYVVGAIKQNVKKNTFSGFKL